MKFIVSLLASVILPTVAVSGKACYFCVNFADDNGYTLWGDESCGDKMTPETKLKDQCEIRLGSPSSQSDAEEACAFIVYEGDYNFTGPHKMTVRGCVRESALPPDSCITMKLREWETYRHTHPWSQIVYEFGAVDFFFNAETEARACIGGQGDSCNGKFDEQRQPKCEGQLCGGAGNLVVALWMCLAAVSLNIIL